MEKNIKTKQFCFEPAPMPKSLVFNFVIQVSEVNQRKVWTIKPKLSASSRLILYLHGGGYISNLSKYDWDFIQELLVKTEATIVVLDYPLAPVANYKDVYAYVDKVYWKLISETSPDNIIFLGNSAGGGIALGFAQKLRNEGKPQPAQIILNSPWLDVTMTNPEIINFDKKDKLLGIKGLELAGQAYAGELDTKDYRISPIYGNFSGLGKISLFIGTHDLFLSDSRRLKAKLKSQNISFNYYEYPKMFHVWIAVTSLKESRHAINHIEALICKRN